MAQIFRQRANAIAVTSIPVAGILLVLVDWITHAVYWSSYTTEVGVPPDQPVPFSHAHHVDGLGIDCRYCHLSVEDASFAGLPSTEICMTCHSEVWSEAPMLAPVRKSMASGQPLRWSRVNDLPDFVFFDHSIHVRKGIGCSSCHGRVDQMPITHKANSLYMRWCLRCHRNPARFVRPRSEIYNMSWQPPTNQLDQGKQLVDKYNIETEQLMDCSVCHR